MRMLIAGSIALVVLAAAPAVAADMSVRAPVPKEPPFPVYNWTGFYVGIQGGGGWSRVAQTDSRPFTSDEYNGTDGVIGGTQASMRNLIAPSSGSRPTGLLPG